MAKRVREENIPLINYISEVKDGDVSDNQDVQRYFCSDKSFVNGIGVTILTGDYLSPLILAEVPLNEDIVQKYIVDGLQRTTALMQIRYGNYKFTGTIEDNEIEYQEKQVDENGKFLRDNDGNFVWEKKIFDIKNKTYDDFPKELKKRFDNYQLRIATYQNCDMKKVSKLVRKLNVQRGMNTSQRALTWIPTYARKIKNIADEGFFKNSIEYSDTARKNGEYMQSVCRSIMNIFHLDSYKRGAKEVCDYLEDNSNIEEFNIVQEYFQRIEAACKDTCKDILVKKDIPVWLTVFSKFTKSGLPDSKFADFIHELSENLHNIDVNGVSYDSLNKESGTTDKKLVVSKINTYTALMNKFLHINEEEAEKEDKNTNSENGDLENPIKSRVLEDENDNETVLSFVQENVDSNATNDDIEAYTDLVDYCFNHGQIKIDAPIYQKCQTALIALMTYACQGENEDKFEEWVKKYQNQTKFSPSQKTNYIFMKNSFDKYISA